MAKQFLVPIDLNLLELQNVRLQSLSSDPSPSEAQIYYNTSISKVKFHNGTSWVSLEDSGGLSGVTSLAGTAPIVVSDSTGDVTISINAATTSLPGSMSAADKTKLDNATNSNTTGAIVSRDGSGNFSAGTITAALTGTASNASLLQNENGAHYLARGNHTGTQAASTISDFDTQVRTNRLDQMATPTASVALGNQRITGLGTPTNGTDAVTKNYVDGLSSGLDYKASVRAATTANITLSGTQTIDTVALVAGNRVLVKNQTDAEDNGIYVVAAGAWARAADAVQGNLTSGAFVYVEEGATPPTGNGGTKFVLTTTDPITVGTTELVWAIYGAGEIIVAGDGLTKTGSTVNVVGTSNRITVAADSVDISSAYVGQSSITTLGTITTGVWQGTTIAANQGGTGIASYTTGNYINAASATTLQQRTPAQVLSDIGGAADNAVVKLTGNQSIDGVKTFTSTISGSISGNAGTATTLATARNINGVSFNGSSDITVPGNFTNRTTNESGHLAFIGTTATGNQAMYTNTGIRVNPSTATITATTFAGALSGNATTATTLQTTRTINGVNFNGSANITITANTPQSLTAGDGLTSAGTFNGSSARTFGLATPGTITGATMNGVTSNSHTHALDISSADISDSTTVGRNFFSATNPSAIRFPRVNADNTVSFLTGADFGDAIGASMLSAQGMMVDPLQSIFTAVEATNPTINDDATDGYTVGSVWANYTTGATYFCYDPTPGAAVWVLFDLSKTANALQTGDAVTSVSAGNGLDFTTITGSGSVTLGTPGTLTGSTTNSVSSTSHTHEINLNASDVGATSKYATTIGNGSSTSFVVTHNLDTYDVFVSVWEAANDGQEVFVDVEKTSVDSITVTFATAPASSSYRVVVVG